jgi:protein-S-isoprenylcysteine O-methyltransferase Ste14
MTDFFNYFQLSALVVYLCLFVGRIIYLRWIKKIRVIVLTTGGKQGLRGILVPAQVVIITVWVALLVMQVTRPEPYLLPPLGIRLIDSTIAKVTGAALVVLGLAVYALALVTLRDSWRVGTDKEKPGELVTQGIYAVTRNPIYISFALNFVGTFLINGALVFLILAILILFNSHYLILREEKFLSKTYGPVFRKYCSRTNRYLSWRRPGRLRARLGYPGGSSG